jgi:hypothetical protein
MYAMQQRREKKEKERRKRRDKREETKEEEGSDGELTWMGVPVSSSRDVEGICFSSCTRRQDRFLMRCPSSRIMYCHAYFSKKGRSIMQISKEVTTTGKDRSFERRVLRRVSRISRRCSLVPWYSTTGQEGSHLWNSFIQLGRVARGPTTRKGPGVPAEEREREREEHRVVRWSGVS